MVNILSVDFDWIMEPYIEFYNQFADDMSDLNMIVPDLNKINPYPDLNKFKLLTTYLYNISNDITDKNNIYFGKRHSEIKDVIENQWKIRMPIHVYNVDHHHDCGYKSTLEAIMNDKYRSNNWPLYIDTIKRYTWIGNENSQPFLVEEVIHHFDQFQQSTDINILNYIKFDYIFVCLSPGWIPKHVLPLYDLLGHIIVHGRDLNE